MFAVCDSHTALALAMLYAILLALEFSATKYLYLFY